ncbi:hypothetical protein Q4508_10815 [Amphritea sp. 2_MG-2023]|uniref:hypothetical protein n=1 Tax=Amphritea TaxID=515417 RepID=UPI001C072A8E|nr:MULTISPECIES: hypothetical protein [Amphritea]MBU2967562.1 hypothetical protein [Amphritea atlantica]MDO6419050.1 hypothetical protein [Amphritea sp. 2_MG-2023]
MLTIAAILLAGLLLSGIYLSVVAGKIAQQQTRQQGTLLGQQTVTLIKPALMAGDSVSLNFILNQLVQQPSVDAIILTDPKDRLLGRAGDVKHDNLIHQEILIRQQKETLAILELRLNPASNKANLNAILIQAAILALITAILALLGCWFFLTRHTSFGLQDSSTTAAPLENTELSLAEATPLNEEIDTASGDNEQLVDLLRPADDAPHMPDFAPFSDHKESPPDEPSLELTLIEEVDLEVEAPRAKPLNPLFANNKHEVQLDLYAFEQELELIVSADEAGYLLYLDLSSGHADNLLSEELQELQAYYYRMLDMVVTIYQGEATRLDNGDLQLAFLKPHKDDSHGINAICASQLFNRLYKLFNQQRIRSLQPVLNLHMALVRGHYQKLARMQEEARYLTHSTDSNELITHTTLSEAPDLKVSLLAGANIVRAEEDKVLIKSVNENYQKLLDKQARHLLSKLFPAS